MRAKRLQKAMEARMDVQTLGEDDDDSINANGDISPPSDGIPPKSGYDDEENIYHRDMHLDDGTLEGLQCMVERRKGGEVGVKAVQCLTGAEMWKACDRGDFSKVLLDATIERVPSHSTGNLRELTSQGKDDGVLLIEYRDGFKTAVVMLSSYLYEGDGGAFCFAAKLKGEAKPRSCQFYLQQPDPFAHFAYQVRAVETMIATGHPPFPVERTYLTTGILDAVMTSVHEGGKRIETPHLKIAYKPTDWPHATGPVPKEIKR